MVYVAVDSRLVVLILLAGWTGEWGFLPGLEGLSEYCDVAAHLDREYQEDGSVGIERSSVERLNAMSPCT